MPRTATLAERFWEKVDKNGPVHPILGTSCWVWTASLGLPWGYGQFYVEPKMRKAHRVSWELHVGPIPDSALVLHRCDNPPCVNPAHLFLGTNSDNRADMDRKGRDAQRRKTHCPRGHAYTAENTHVNERGQRSCRACRATKATEYNRRQWQRHLALVAAGERAPISHATGRPKGSHNASKTHCAHGHAFDEANTRVAADGKRSCRACGRAYYHRHRKAS